MEEKTCAFSNSANGIGSAQNQPWLEVGKYFFRPITDDEPPNIFTCAHYDDEEFSYVSESESSTNWETMNISPHCD